jgi:transcriptional repressor NrdR
VTSAEIGELVLARLKDVNEVAFVRFASVYRQFQGIRDFADTLQQLQEAAVNQRARGENPANSSRLGNSVAIFIMQRHTATS